MMRAARASLHPARMKLALLLVSLAACQSHAPTPDPVVTSELIDWTWPTHIRGGLGAKPWDGAFVVPGGIVVPSTGAVLHPVGNWLAYNSLDAGVLREAGFGMRLAVLERLVVTGTTVTWLRPDGEPIVFPSDGSGGFVTPPETDMRLSQPDAASYEIRLIGATRMVFRQPNGTGWLLDSIVDRNGNATTYQYDGANRLVRILDPVAQSVQLEYGGNGMISRIVEPDGQAWALGYNYWYELTSMRRESDGATQTLVYDPYYLHLLAEHRSAEGEALAHFDFYADRSVRGAADAAGAKMVMGYYAGQVRVADSFHQTTTLEFTPAGELRTVIDPIGVPLVRNTYDAQHRTLTTTDSTGFSDAFAYDANHNVIRHVNGNGETTTATYVDHNATSVTSATGKTTFYTYGPYDEITSIVDARGRRTDIAYDGRGNPLFVRGSDGTIVAAYTWDSHGLLTSITDAVGDMDQFGYDASRNLRLQVTASGQPWRFASTPDGRPLSITTPRGDQTRFAYDGVNRPARVDYADRVTETTTWDRDDRLLERRRVFGGTALRAGPTESVTSCTYDNRGGAGEDFNDEDVETCEPGDEYDDPEVPPEDDDDGDDTSTDTSTGSDTVTDTSTSSVTR
jgi:YD repeat-containing protein